MIAKLNSVGDGKHEYILFIKGAPEVISNKCSKILTKNGEIEFNDNQIKQFEVNKFPFKNNTNSTHSV